MLPEAGRSFSGQNAPTLGDKVRFLKLPSDVFMRPRAGSRTRDPHVLGLHGGRSRLQAEEPVRFAYLDFSTLDRREAACRSEFLLNRRLAPDIFLAVAPLTISIIRSRNLRRWARCGLAGGHAST